jgi:hypothetical protein
MAFHFHLDGNNNNNNNNNNKVVNNHKNVPFETTKFGPETAGGPSTNYMGVNTPSHPSSPISFENNVKNNQNSGLVPISSNSDSTPPPPSDSNFLGALKEWAVVCDAIESGNQILLFRKGGIMEYRNGFELKFKKFFLFPTFEHQARESIRPEYHPILDQIEEKNNDIGDTETTTTENNNSSPSKKYTEITSFVEIIDSSEVRSLDRLKALKDFHIWTDDYLKMRFNYNPKKPLHLLLLRAYKLKVPLKITNKPQWIGCKSWIQIDSHDRDLDLYFANNSLSENPFEYLKSISNPCIDDNKFNKLSEKVRSII